MASSGVPGLPDRVRSACEYGLLGLCEDFLNGFIYFDFFKLRATTFFPAENFAGLTLKVISEENLKKELLHNPHDVLAQIDLSLSI